jgi:hypothetical protein
VRKDSRTNCITSGQSNIGSILGITSGGTDSKSVCSANTCADDGCTDGDPGGYAYTSTHTAPLRRGNRCVRPSLNDVYSLVASWRHRLHVRMSVWFYSIVWHV